MVKVDLTSSVSFNLTPTVTFLRKTQFQADIQTSRSWKGKIPIQFLIIRKIYNLIVDK